MQLKFSDRLVALAARTHGLIVFRVVRLGFFGLASKLLYRLEKRACGEQKHPHVLQVVSVENGAVRENARKISVIPSRKLTLKAIKQLGFHAGKARFSNEDNDVFFPELAIYKFNNCQIIGGSEMIVSSSGELLYDEIALGDTDVYGTKAIGIIHGQSFFKCLPAYSKGRVLLSISDISPMSDAANISRAIHLLKDHSANYYHWLFECLPRAIAVINCGQFDGIPLLVDAGLPRQCLDALNVLAGSRKIILVPRCIAYKVDELIFPSVISHMHDNYGSHSSAADILIAPEAIRMLRKAYLTVEQCVGKRKIYISRKGANYRRLLNESRIIHALKKRGFEEVYPETLSFQEQVELFSSAEIIVGPTGAGMSNIVFAPAGCKVIVLAAATIGANYYIFGQLGQWLNHKLIYLTGRPIKPARLHSDYHINLPELLWAISDLELLNE